MQAHNRVRLAGVVTLVINQIMQNTLNHALPSANTGVANVKTFGAKGDGVTDDTAAIQDAIKNTLRQNSKQGLVYFPDGTYLISDSIKAIRADGAYEAYLTLQGQSLNGTIIKLKNSCSGFTNASTPKKLFISGSQNPHADGGGNEAFRNNIYHMTVDTGTGNLGAIGIDYLANNKGSLRNVTIKGSGKCGLDMSREWIGCCLIKDLKVIGFDYGIRTDNHYQYGVTMEHIYLEGQKVAGILNKNNVLSIRDLVSVNSVPAIKNTGSNGVVTLIKANLSGGSSSIEAIDNVGNFYTRSLTTSGYKSAIKNDGVSVPGLIVDEYSTTPWFNLFTPVLTPLKLSIEETRTFYEDSSLWANVRDFGAVPDNNDDDTPEIQAAIDSGATTIYFPTGVYNIRSTIIIRGNVKRIVGMESFLKPRATYDMPVPAIRFEGTVNDCIIEGLSIKGIWEHDTPKKLTLTDCGNGSYKAYPGAGNLYTENTMIGVWHFVPGQKIWMRQLNSEFTDETRLVNDGADLWILGIKTEAPYTVIETKNGGRTELLGGLLYPGIGNQVPPTDKAFINNESSLSMLYTMSSDGAGQEYTIHAETKKGGVTKTYTKDNVVDRGNGCVVYYRD